MERITVREKGRKRQMKIPKIKICGLTTVREAVWCLEEKVNYTGMVVFFEKSKRNVDIEKAKEMLMVLHGGSTQQKVSKNSSGEAADSGGVASEQMQVVAVTVSPTPEQVLAIQEAGFDMIQIHGELSKEAFDAIEIPMIRAFNGCDRVLYDRYHHCDKVAAYLFDAKMPGSGETFDWRVLQQIPRDEKLFFLAGGLHPDNIRQAIRQVQPDVVDVSSGVEIAPEVVGKNREKIRAFVHNVREQ